MRLFVYQAGNPGFVLSECVMPDAEWAEHVEQGANPATSMWVNVETGYPDAKDRPRYEVLTREQMLEVSTRRRALLLWEAKDDEAFEKTQTVARYNSYLDDVRLGAKEGCSMALEVLALDEPPFERLVDVVSRHVCEEGECLPPRMHLV